MNSNEFRNINESDWKFNVIKFNVIKFNVIKFNVIKFNVIKNFFIFCFFSIIFIVFIVFQLNFFFQNSKKFDIKNQCKKSKMIGFAISKGFISTDFQAVKLRLQQKTVHLLDLSIPSDVWFGVNEIKFTKLGFF
jgi:hypothetical protein